MCTSRTALDGAPNDEGTPVFFSLSSWQLGLLLAVIMFGATIVGLVIGRILSHHAESLREPFGAVQAALLDARRARPRVRPRDGRRPLRLEACGGASTTRTRSALPTSALNCSPEPVRSRSLSLCAAYTDARLRVSRDGAGQRGMRRAIAAEDRHPAAALALRRARPSRRADRASAPRVYVESLNSMIEHADDARSRR